MTDTDPAPLAALLHMIEDPNVGNGPSLKQQRLAARLIAAGVTISRPAPDATPGYDGPPCLHPNVACLDCGEGFPNARPAPDAAHTFEGCWCGKAHESADGKCWNCGCPNPEYVRYLADPSPAPDATLDVDSMAAAIRKAGLFLPGSDPHDYAVHILAALATPEPADRQAGEGS